MKGGLFVLLLCVTQFMRKAKSCQDGYTEHNSSCYHFVDDHEKSWQEAKDFCRKEGGYLVEISSAQENTFLKETSKRLKSNGFWIGGSFIERSWIWDSQNEVITDSYWAPNQPNNDEKCCICLKETRHFLWVDALCDRKTNFICEVESFSARYVEFNSSWYYFGNEQQKNWQQAKIFCRGLGGYLTNINTPEEHNFVVNEVKSRPPVGDVKWNYWIGGSCIKRRWIWDRKGEIIDDFYWAPEDPNYFEQSCISLSKDQDFLWNDQLCTKQYNFICEAEQVLETTTTTEQEQSTSKLILMEVTKTKAVNRDSTTEEQHDVITPTTEKTTNTKHDQPKNELLSMAVTKRKAVSTDSTTNEQPHVATSTTDGVITKQNQSTASETNYQPTTTIKSKNKTSILGTEQTTIRQFTSERKMICQQTTLSGNENCTCAYAINESIKVILETIQELRRSLKINKNTTSKFRRSLISATDKRISARAIGSVGVVILVSVVLCIVAIDVHRVINCLQSNNNRRKKRKTMATKV